MLRDINIATWLVVGGCISSPLYAYSGHPAKPTHSKTAVVKSTIPPIHLFSSGPSDLQTFQAMLKRGDDLNCLKDKQFAMFAKDGVTPLMLAVMDGQLDAIKFLLLHKVDVNAEDFAGMTALDIVPLADSHIADIKTLLTQNGAHEGDGDKAIVSSDGKLIARVTSFTLPTDDSPTVVIKGTVVNATGKTLTYVEIDANFENGDVVDSGIANAENIAPGEAWDFTITSLKTDAVGYKLTQLTYNVK